MTQYDLFVPNDRFGSNTYLLFTEDDACVIDASVPLRQIRRAARPPHISFVLLTHGHFDHILALSSYAEAGIPIYMAGEDIPMLTNAYRNASLLFGQDLTVLCRPTAIKQGDSLSVGGVPIQTIASPGHTPGSLCFSVDRFLFTGDTLFAGGGYGRTDLPEGCFDDLAASLRALAALDPTLRILPGHGEEDLLGDSLYNLVY